jgi:Na+-transporting NADH:ubiquinone oxidoreductase subunit C
MDVNSNKYTYLFATIMVVLVAFILSGLSLSLKERQNANIELEKRQNILQSVGIKVERSEAKEAYDEYITESVVIQNGAVVSEDANEAFNIDMAKAVASGPEERKVPLYVANVEGETFYILPMRGKGLWGPIWGYVALKDDGNTVAGATFDHKGETPGLGAEISTSSFQEQFANKSIMDGGNFVSISVIKPGKNVNPEHEVDGISGGTITSVGLNDMLADCFLPYVGYFQSSKNAQVSAL